MNQMNYGKVRVKIGRKYQAAFRSICDLASNGCIDQSIVRSCHDNCIETDQYIFEYTGEQAAIDTGTQTGMLASGASWFRNFRDGESTEVIGAWHNLIEAVATDYHKEYSLVEYVQSGQNRDTEEMERYRDAVRHVAEVLSLPFTRVVDAGGDDRVEDIYAISLRLELYGGAGEPRPVLCKVYFRNRANALFPLDKDEAEMVDGYISNIVGNQRGAGMSHGEESETTIVDTVLNSISKLIQGDFATPFVDSVLVTNETDAATLQELVQVEPQDEVCLVCKKLKVLGISHIRWTNEAFNIYVGDRKAFLAKVGLTNTISLYCCCNSEDNKLIENNTICCVSPDTGEVTRFRLDLEAPDLGLSKDDVDRIRNESAVGRHFYPISCSEMRRRQIMCTQYRCDNGTVNFEVDGRTVCKCADCPHPEVVYRCPDGRAVYTPSMGFDTATLSAVEGHTATCRFCGRSYAVDSPAVNYLCGFCKDAFDRAEYGENMAVERKNYRRYAGMLSTWVRLRSLFGRKYCFENADRLVFVVGKHKYFFDKLKLEDRGLIDKPEKRQ